MSLPTDEPWITTLISDSCQKHPLVNEAVSVQLQELLSSRFTEHQLTEVELRKVAHSLIDAMATPSSKGKEK